MVELTDPEREAILLDAAARGHISRRSVLELAGALGLGTLIGSPPLRLFRTDIARAADGHSDAVKQQATKLISLSALTLPHQLVRVVVAEQLYRAWTILARHPYHRE